MNQHMATTPMYKGQGDSLKFNESPHRVYSHVQGVCLCNERTKPFNEPTHGVSSHVLGLR